MRNKNYFCNIKNSCFAYFNFYCTNHSYEIYFFNKKSISCIFCNNRLNFATKINNAYNYKMVVGLSKGKCCFSLNS